VPRWNALNATRSRGTKAETKADTTAVSSYFGAFLDFCRFRKFRYFNKLHLHKAARSTEI